MGKALNRKAIICFLTFAVIMSLVLPLCAYADQGTRTVTVTALGEQNENAQGSEIWIKSIVIDGKETNPEKAFSLGWIADEGYLKWRGYDQPEGMTNSVSAVVPEDAEVYVVFQSNLWRGIAQVTDGDKTYQVDCYGDNEDGTHVVRSDGEQSESGWSFADIRVPGKTLAVWILGVLLVLAAVCVLIDRKKSGRNPEKLTRGGSQKRELWLDILKVISAPLIVLIHTVGGGYGSTPLDSGKWVGYLVLNTIPRCAVPIFIMVSGALLLGKEMPVKKAWRKAKKAIVLLVVWNLAYIITQSLLWGPSEPIWKQILSLPVKRGPSGHLWYAHFLVWVYLFAPVASVLYQVLTEKKRVYFVLITVIVPGLLDLYLKVFDINSPSVLPAFSLYMALTYMGMMFLGRMICEKVRGGAKELIYSLICALAGFLGMLAITYIYVKDHGAATDIFMSETQLLAVCFGAGLMGVSTSLRRIFERWPEKLQKVIVEISKCSLGVYFIHEIFIWTVGDIKIGSHLLSSMDRPIEALVLTGIYYILGLAAAIMMSKIPGLRKLVK